MVLYNLEKVNQHQAELVKGRKDKRYLSEKVLKKKNSTYKTEKVVQIERKDKKNMSEKSVLNGHRAVPVNTTQFNFSKRNGFMGYVGNSDCGGLLLSSYILLFYIEKILKFWF